MSSELNKCPCGLNKNYNECCGRFINGDQYPSTPEELMRSRYTAYTQANIDYIQQTMKLPAANLFDAEKVRQWATEIKWIGLKVIASSCDKTKGIVEFVASFSYHDQLQQMHEHSEFRLEEGKWFYVDGKILPSHPTTATVSKIGRNETCPCGSGKKFKKCCGI